MSIEARLLSIQTITPPPLRRQVKVPKISKEKLNKLKYF